MSDAATRDAQATAEAKAGEAIAAERERVRHDAEQTLVDELASAQERHHADIAALNVEATARSEVATRAAQGAAEALAEETLATERARLQADESAAQEPARPADAQAIHTLEAELDRVRADAERTLAAELAAAEARNRTEILRVRADTQESLAEQLEQVQAEADQARDEVARLVAARQTSASRELRPNVESASWRSAAGSTSIPRHASAPGRWVRARIGSGRTQEAIVRRTTRPTTTICGPRVSTGPLRPPRRPRPSRNGRVGGRGAVGRWRPPPSW